MSKASFTGAAHRRPGPPGAFRDAAGGTLFLDEIGDMAAPIAGQDPARAPGAGRHAVGGKPVAPQRTRLAATTSRSRQVVAAREFREDPTNRLNVVPLGFPHCAIARQTSSPPPSIFPPAPRLQRTAKQLNAAAIDKCAIMPGPAMPRAPQCDRAAYIMTRAPHLGPATSITSATERKAAACSSMRNSCCSRPAREDDDQARLDAAVGIAPRRRGVLNITAASSTPRSALVSPDVRKSDGACGKMTTDIGIVGIIPFNNERADGRRLLKSGDDNVANRRSFP